MARAASAHAGNEPPLVRHHLRTATQADVPTFSRNCHCSHNYWCAHFWPNFGVQGKTRTQIYKYAVGNSRPSDPNLTDENSWTEEEGEEREALSPQRMPGMLTMARPVVQTTSGAGPSTSQDDKPPQEQDPPVSSRMRSKKPSAG